MKYVAYYRVSTREQGDSGLGLEAQRASVKRFIGQGTRLLGEYTEVESGKKDRRQELEKAIAHSKRAGAKLLIAKLDRLSRNAAFILQLRDSGVDFICCDMPEATSLTIGFMAILAQHEREVISQRTKAALAAKKAQGFKLGCPENLTPEAIAKGRKTMMDNARTDPNNILSTEIIVNYRDMGRSYYWIANRLNKLGMKTRYGCLHTPDSVRRLYLRAGKHKGQGAVHKT